MDAFQAKQYNGAALAYIGDACYETYVRQHVLLNGGSQVNRLHKAAVKYVEAKGQADVIRHWLETDVLTPEEIEIFKRGRNHRANTRAKNANIGDYRRATGFEAVLGWLHLSQQTDRLEFLIQAAIQWLDSQAN